MRWTGRSVRRRFTFLFFMASGLILPASFNACMPSAPEGALEEALQPNTGKNSGSSRTGTPATGGVAFGGSGSGSGSGSGFGSGSGSGAGSGSGGVSFGGGGSGSGGGDGDYYEGFPGGGGGNDGGPLYDVNAFRKKATLRVLNYNIRAIPCLKPARYIGGDDVYSALGNVIRSLRPCALDDTQYAAYYDTRLQFLANYIGSFRGSGLEPDVVIVQEAYRGAGGLFNDAKARSLKSSLGYSYAIYGAESALTEPQLVTQLTYLKNSRASVKNLMDSGLVILSRHPLQKLGEVSFSHCYGNDCAFKKGALAVRVSHPSGAIDIVATHMQDREAAGIEAQDTARMNQLAEVRNLIEQKLGASYVLLSGDMGFSHEASNSSSGVFNIRFPDFTHMGKTCLQEPSYCARPTTAKDPILSGQGPIHLYWRAGVDRVAPRQYFVDQFNFYNGSGQQGVISDRDYHLVEMDLLVRK